VGTTVVVGLGNPGQEYVGSRHNVGFMVADELSRRTRAQFKPGKGEFWYARAGGEDSGLLLIKPVTYMNRSGEAVLDVLGQFGVAPQDVVVVLDDFALPLGALRLRPGGSDGGHNGLASVIYQLQTDRVVRLRCGIRGEVMPPKEMTADFVLSQFDGTERATVEAMVGRAADAVQELQRSGLEHAMSLYNVAFFS
jgi:peptidyl-tRNA hydrolase, PTH1 family